MFAETKTSDPNVLLRTLFSDNVLRREFHVQIEENLKEEFMADVPEQFIEDFIQNLMEDFDRGFDRKLIEVSTQHGIETFVEYLIEDW